MGASARVNNRFSAGVRVGVLAVRTEGLSDRGGLVQGRRSRRRSSVATSIASAVMIKTTHLINN